ncbi:MAG: leucine-rich repeat domain-containing protein [Spirochaetaceae bacterium]|nr:leucine-rich repeat domain-containing protein [Spirochaetaceae bacterium]
MNRTRKIFLLVALLLFALSVQNIFAQIKTDIHGWKDGDFTTTWTEYVWEFNASDFKKGENTITFTFGWGSHMLCLKDVTIIADGKTVASVPEQKTSGNNPKNAVYTFNLTSAPRTLTFKAMARTGGGNNSNGKININGILYLPSTSQEIKGQAYYGNKDIVKVVIPSSVTKIGGLAFHSCPNLKEIEIPSSVKTIGDAAFQNCTALEKITLNEGLTNLGYRLFKGCTNLKEIYIPSTVTDFSTEIFSDCKNLTTIMADRYTEAHAFLSADSRLVLTSKRPKQTKEQWIATAKNNILDDGILYVGHGITKINDGEYKDKGIREIVFSDSLEKIGAGAFQNNKDLKKVVIPGNVKVIADGAFAGLNIEEVVCEEGVEKIQVYAFYGCDKLNSVTLPKSATSIVPDGLYWQNKSSRVFHCYAGSRAYNLAVEYGFGKIDVLGIDEAHKDTIDLKYMGLGGNKTVKAGLLRDYPIEMIDLGNDITEIGRNAFNDKSLLRVKKNTGGDKWCKANGYYLCEVLSDLNVYTKDRSKQITEDFTRILYDDEPYAVWTSYSFNTQHPLKLEEVDNKLVLTSFMMKPCQNVTVTTKDGKTLIRNKTIQPLTRTVICDFDFLTDNVENYTVTSTDSLYKRLTVIPISWNISFSGFVRRESTSEDNFITTMRPVYAREYIPGIYNVAEIMGSAEYERRCYQAVENKTLVTDEALTVPLTKEQMEKLLAKTKNWSLTLGRDTIAGTGGGNWLSMTWDFIVAFSHGKPSAFWHEFSHCMGWAHEQGNMCYQGRPEPYDVDWPSIGSLLYQEEYKKGNVPYVFTQQSLNSFLFSGDVMYPPKYMDDDKVINGTLYVTEGMPTVDSHKKQTDFTKVVIPSSVEVISDSAFYDCKLDEVTIPSSVTKINSSAFYGCLSLGKIEIPDTVKYVGSSAFQNCTSLTSVKIGSGIRQISSSMFKASSLLAEVTIPGTVKYIGNAAFQDCRSLSNVVIKDGVRKIGDNAFNNTAITEITIPASVTDIGKNITSKNVIWNVKEGTYAYNFAKENGFLIGTLEDKGKTILAESKDAASVPNDVWQNGIFAKKDERRKWDFSKYLNGGGSYTITFRYSSGSDILRLTDTVFAADGKTIAYFPEQRSVGSSYRETIFNITVPAGTNKLEMYALARAGNSNITGTIAVSNMNVARLVIPVTTETIKDSAYFGSKYEEVVFPSGLKKIGTMAFQDSTELKSVTIPDSVTDIGNSAFHNCPSLTFAKIGSGLTKLNTKLFKNTALTEITIPSNILTIGEEAFRDCEFLTKADISYGVTKIDKNAFNNCHELKTITIPNSVTDMGEGAFQNCTSLSSAKIGSGLQKLNKAVFKDSGLTSITIPGSIETIGESAFAECANLKNVTIQYGVKEIARNAFAYSTFTSLNIPTSVTKIGVRAFDNAAITKVTLPSGLVEMSTCAFIDSALTEVTIPGSLKVIDVKVFQGCENLTKVVINNGVEEICEKAFWDTGIKEIKIPSSVKSIGFKIVPEDTVWDVEVGSYAYLYALENNFKIKTTDAVLKDKTARFLADKSIESAPADKWQKGTFTKDDVRRKWDFSSSLKGSGTYTITFKYTSGAHKLSLTDSFIIADGKLLAYYPETLSAGSNPNKFTFTVEVPAGTKKLELYAFAKGGGGSDSNGTITVEKK